MEALNTPVLLLSFAIILALAIERLLEIIKSIYDYFDARIMKSRGWTRHAEQIRDKLERRLNQVDNEHQLKVIMSLALRYLSVPDSRQAGAMTVSADKVRTLIIKVTFKTLAIILGIIFARLFDIDILELSKYSMQYSKEALVLIKYNPTWYGIILSGVAMGLGTGPLNKIIQALEKARKSRKKPEGI